MSKEKKRVPRLRFPGFTGDWEQRKLGNLTQLITKGTTPKVKNIQNGINFIKVENISDDGVISINSYVSEEEHMNYLSRSILANNDILFSIAGTLGRTAIVKSHLLPANTNQALAIIRLNKSVDVEYINTFLKSNAIKTYIRKNPTVGAQPNLSLGQVSDLEINIPNYSEQKKISNLFSKFDLMITLHQRKLNHLILKKKSLLQKLFPKNGDRYPELRFPGFTDVWEQRKLGDIATITGGGTPSTNISEYWNGDIDWYSPVEIGEKRYASGSIRKITKLGLEKSSAKILPVGTVLFTSRAGIGNTAILQVEGCTNQGFQSITPNSKELDTYFLYTMTSKLKRYGEVTGAGSTFVEVSGKQMEQMNLMIPSLDEQKYVSQLFKVMDDAITLHQRKLDHLLLQKKALLQQMFV